MIFLHDETDHLPDKHSDIVTLVYDEISPDKPNALQIVDPYFNLFLLARAYKENTGSFWQRMFEELASIRTLKTIDIITNEEFSKITSEELQLLGITKVSPIKLSFDFWGAYDFQLSVLVYRKNHDATNQKPWPDLHDRWFIWADASTSKALHFGCLKDTFLNSDLTITFMDNKDAATAATRFSEYTKYGGSK